MRFRIFCTTIVLSLTAFLASTETFAQAPAASQSTPSASGVPRTITLDDAIKAAMARNYTTRLASNQVRKDEFAARSAADNMWLPSVKATGGWQYDYSFNPIDEEVVQNPFVPVVVNGDTDLVPNPNPTYTRVTAQNGTQSLNYNVGASINLFNGFADLASIHQTEATLGSAQNSLTWTRQQTADNVVKAYLSILLTQELVYAADSTLAEAQAQFSLVQGQYQAGVVAIAQIYTQQSVVVGDSLALIQADVNFQNAKVSLLYLLNVPPNQFNNYSFNADGIDTATTPAARAAVDTSIQPEAINAAIDNRPDILAQEESIKASEEVVNITRGQFYPSLDATLGVGGSGSGPNLTTIHLNNGLNAGLQLTIPIFDKFQTTLTVDEQEVDVENARITLEQDVQQMRSSVTIDVNTLKATEKSLDATESAFRAASESFRLANEQLQVGSGTEVAVVIAEAALETARTNRVNAKYNWVLAQKQVAYDLGKWNY